MIPEATRNRKEVGIARHLALAALLLATSPSDLEATQTIRDENAPAAASMFTSRAFGGFVANQGQWNTSARFVGELGNTVVRAESGGIVVQSAASDGNPARAGVVRMAFECGAFVEPRGGKRVAGEFNYFTGNDPARWRRHVPSYADVVYTGICAGTDLRLYEQDGRLEYDLHLSSEADLRDFIVRCEGVNDLEIEDDGDLRMETPIGPLIQHAPTAWQVTRDGQRVATTCTFRVVDCQHFALDVPGRLPDASLVIDPGLTWATFLGGALQDRSVAVKISSSGDPLVLGRTNSLNFPTTAGAFDPIVNSYDMTVTCFDPSGSSLVFSTVVGGADWEYPNVLALAADGSIAIGGWSKSTDYPALPSSYDTTFAGGDGDACVTVLTPDGSDISFSTLLGGGCFDEVDGLAFTSAGKIVVAGQTCSPDFPVSLSALDPTYGALEDGFVAWFDPTLSGSAELLYSTFLGTADDDHILDLAMAPNDEPIVVGQTTSTSFPTTPGAFDQSAGQAGLSGFVTRLSADGRSLVASTHLKTALPMRVTLDGATVVVAGFADAGFPVTPNAFDTTPNGFEDCLVARLDGQLGQLLAATYVGGQSHDAPLGLAMDVDGSIVFAGETSSGNYPTTPGAFDTSGSSGTTTMVSRLSGDMSHLLYSSFLGDAGPTSSWANGVAVIGPSDVVIVGEGATTGFPVTPGAFDTTFNGGNLGGADGYVARMLLKTTWTALSGALAGSNGTPQLSGSGELVSGTPVTLMLRHAKPSAAATLLIGLSLLDAPFKGGLVVPTPDVLLVGLPVDGQGMLALNSTWPSGVPSNFTFYTQFWIADAAGPKGFAASNGLSGSTP